MKLSEEQSSLPMAVDMLVHAGATRPGGKARNLAMPGDPHYQPKDLQCFLGYDQRVLWQALVEWFWMLTLADTGIISRRVGVLLTPSLLLKIFSRLCTRKVKHIEDTITKHDVLALLIEMRKVLPVELHPFLHFGLTSYDVISTAFALQAKWTFSEVFFPKLKEVDEMWRAKIRLYSHTLQIHRTHLQNALPGTVGFWLTPLHRRFVNNSVRARFQSLEIPGKFSGATGSSAALHARFSHLNLEEKALHLLDLPPAQPATQLPLPEGLARFYTELNFISAALSNLGDDVRHLQASAIGEVTSASSSSSAMAHKDENPVAAENLDGMQVTVHCDLLKVLETLNSTLQRDLRWSNVMRGYSTIMVSVYQQLLTTVRLFKSFKVNEDRCTVNLQNAGTAITAELLHLSLQHAGFTGSHDFVNKRVTPAAKTFRQDLGTVMEQLPEMKRNKALARAWRKVPGDLKRVISDPRRYLGKAIDLAVAESEYILNSH